MSSLSVGTICLLLAIVSASSSGAGPLRLTGASHPMIVARRNGVKKRLPHGVLAFWCFGTSYEKTASQESHITKQRTES